MSKVETISEKSSLPKQMSIKESDSGSKTYVDSLHNSKLREKENLDLNSYKNITEIYVPKTKQLSININNKKEKNFYLALRTLNEEYSGTINSSKISENFLSKISEFSIMNPDISKDYNVSKYLHHPIVKQIMKLGNNIIKKQNTNEYRVNYGLEINKPLVSVYNMKNIFEKFNSSYIFLENSTSKSIINQNGTINNKDIIFNKRKKLKYFHRKNKSSITNYYFNDNNNNNLSKITSNNHDNNKKKKNSFHFRDHLSSLIGIQNKIIIRNKDSATTITKEDNNNKDFHIQELNDINININKFNNNKNLEEIHDLDKAKQSKIYSTNKKDDIFNNIISDNKGMTIKNFFGNKDNNMKIFDKQYNLTMNKTLRKKYERTEFIFKNKNYKNNNTFMKNLMDKFERCYENEKNKTFDDNHISDSIDEKTNNKNNDTFIIKDITDNFRLSLEVSEYNNNIQLSELSSNILCDIKSNKINKTNLKLSCIKSVEENSLNKKTINTYPLTNSEKNKKDKNKNNYESPDNLNKNKHNFDLLSTFRGNNIKEILTNDDSYNYRKIKRKDNNNVNDEEQIYSVFEYTFYQNLLKTEDIMTKKNKIILKNELILNTELRLEILVWMMKISEEFAFKRDTYHNACYYFDMFLALQTLNKSNNKKSEINLKDKTELKLIGLTCIVISAKLEEIQLPRLKEYSELLSNKYNINTIIEMEKRICSGLRWKLTVITKNTWLSWYICQWDLFIDTVDDIKKKLLDFIPEVEILYFKHPDNNSYYNFRKICQLVDIMTLDFHSYYYEPRLLIAVSFFIILCNKYKLKYNLKKRKFDNKTNLSDLLLDLYKNFISQSFDFDFSNNNLQKGINYFYNNYINFEFIFDLPLFYQIYPNKMYSDSFEDFLSYQTTNDNFFRIVKQRTKFYKNGNRIVKKFKSKKKNNFIISKDIFHKKPFS